MEMVTVRDPVSGEIRTMEREAALAMLDRQGRLRRRLEVAMRGGLWIAGFGYLAAAIWAVGPHVLWGVLGGLLLAWAWRTRR